MIKSRSEKWLEKRALPPLVTEKMVRSVSDYRRNQLESEVQAGLFSEPGAQSKHEDGTTVLGVVASSGIRKHAQDSGMGMGGGGVGSGGSGGYRGSGGTTRQTPEVYSPLWLLSNLNLPRDRATINSWCRAFFALNPMVQNAITLHSTYPIAKLNIRCKNQKVEKFFNEMIEETELMDICVQIAQEYWTLGEAFVYGEFDESTAKWSRFTLQNPDYIHVKRSVIAGEPVISLRPDENLRNIVNSNRPADIQQRKQLDKSIIEHVRRGENIPLNNFYVSHLARKISPYEIRGTGLVVSCFKALMLFDKIKECYSEDTEVLTDKGFKNIKDLLEYSSDINLSEKYVAGALVDEKGNIGPLLKMKEDFKVACVNPENNEVEYHKPIELHMSQYNGKMIHFNGKKVDVLVTPNHKMWAKENKTHGQGYTQYNKIYAQDILKKKTYWKFLSKVNYSLGNNPKEVDVAGYKVPIELYLKVMGYVLSEGCIYEKLGNGRYDATTLITQSISSDCYEDMRNSFDKFAELLNRKTSNRVNFIGAGYSKDKPQDLWSGRISGKDLTKHFKDTIGVNGDTKSINKHIPRWILDLKPELLKIILESLVFGDGSNRTSKYGTNSKSFTYSTISKQLADDVYEIVYKLGFVPNICISNRIFHEDIERKVTEYIVMWSDTNYGNEPIITTFKRNDKNNGGGARAQEVDYNGVVWCFEVPTGLFITRRNSKITVQGNCKFAQADSLINPITLVKIGNENYKPTPADIEEYRQAFAEAQYDHDFKLFTHEALTVERVGAAGAIFDTANDITQCIKEIYIGLMVPSVLMDGGADTTYSNGSVALDVLRGRYMQFRNMLSNWLKRKIFAPISKVNDFYEVIDGKKVLIVPDVDWNHMSLFDSMDYVSQMVTLSTGEKKKASLHTLYKSMGLEWEDEQRKIAEEAIDEAILAKQMEALSKMGLNELKAVDKPEDIKEVLESPLPGENASETPSEGGSGGGMPPLPGVEPSGGSESPPPPPPVPPPPPTK
jgi:hypothetical protein